MVDFRLGSFASILPRPLSHCPVLTLFALPRPACLFASCLHESVGPFVRSAGPPVGVFAPSAGPPRPLFASPCHAVGKPVQLGGGITLSEAYIRGERDARRGYHRARRPNEQPARHSGPRRFRPHICPGRTSPVAGPTPWVMVSGARERLYPSRGPLRRYPSQKLASPGRTRPAAGAVFRPRPASRADTQDTRLLGPPVLEKPG